MQNLNNKISLSSLHACIHNYFVMRIEEKLLYLCINNVRFKVPIFYNFIKNISIIGLCYSS